MLLLPLIDINRKPFCIGFMRVVRILPGTAEPHPNIVICLVQVLLTRPHENPTLASGVIRNPEDGFLRLRFRAAQSGSNLSYDPALRFDDDWFTHASPRLRHIFLLLLPSQPMLLNLNLQLSATI